jgi:ribonucleoside-diphosphate reductase alpha chain
MFEKYSKIDKQLVEKSIQGVDNLKEQSRIVGNIIKHPEYQLLAGELLHKYNVQVAPKTIEEYVETFSKTLSEKSKTFLLNNKDDLQDFIDKYEYVQMDYFSYSTMFGSYCTKKVGSDIVELPIHVFLRVAMELYGSDGNFEEFVTVLDDLMQGYYNHASPTLFNAGTKKNQMASCYLISVEDDLDSILDTHTQIGKCSASCGGIGIDVSRLRTSDIGQIGSSSGVVPYAKMMSSTLSYLNQGGRREGAGTLSCNIWHADIPRFIDMVRNNVKDESNRNEISQKLTSLFTSVSTNDLFYERLREDGNWSLFCPQKANILLDKIGKEFKEAYIKCENDPELEPYKYTMKARDLMNQIVSSQTDCGMPFIKNMDSVNRKSNQKNLGYIRHSNLCQEIDIFTGPNDVGVCVLGNMILYKYVVDKIDFTKEYKSEEEICNDLRKCFDFKLLGSKVRQMVRNLNKVIDKNWFPTDKNIIKMDYVNKVSKEFFDLKLNGNVTSTSPEDLGNSGTIKSIANDTNQRNRPIGIGVCGYIEALYMLDIDYESQVSQVLNKMIFACIYFNSLQESVELAKINGKYQNFDGSPFSQGKLQFDLWKEEYEELKSKIRKPEDDEPMNPSMWGETKTWEELKQEIMTHGTRNSLLTAVMPTASTAHIRMAGEAMEAHQNNMYIKRGQNGSYTLLNSYLVRDLEALNLWNDDMIHFLEVNRGNINNIKEHVNTKIFKINQRLDHLIKKYKTMWDIDPFVMLNMRAARGRYIDQSESGNIYLAEGKSRAYLTKLLRYANELGIKTICYYIRTKGGDAPIFNLPKSVEKVKMIYEKEESCKLEESCNLEVVSTGDCMSCN